MDLSMINTKTARVYITTLLTLSLIDGVWLTLVSPKVYKHYIGYLTAPKFSFAPAVLFYLLFPIGLMIFVILPALQKKNTIKFAASRGALFGLFCYATFDLSNQAILPHWPTTITIIDMSWGASLSAAVAIISYSFSKKFIK
jgi:hypothetical protein